MLLAGIVVVGIAACLLRVLNPRRGRGDVLEHRTAAAAATVVMLVVVGGAGALLVGIDSGGSSHRYRRTLLPSVSSPPKGSPPTPLSSAAPTLRPAPARAPVGPAALPRPSVQQFGAGVQGIFLNSSQYTARQITAQLAALRVTGATIARSDALWEAIEPDPPVDGHHAYHWQLDDLTVAALAARGLRWLPIVDYSPPWAAAAPSQTHSPPRAENVDDFAAFAAALAKRYGPAGAFWRALPGLRRKPVDTYEIWNEPDISVFWGPAPNAARYADLYLRARDAIKAVDPHARVIVGGLTAPGSFLPVMLAARPDLRGHIDGVAIHPWGPTPGAVLRNVRSARTEMRRLRLRSVAIYVTAFGWTTRPSGAFSYLPARLRPRYIAATTTALGHTNCQIAAVILNTWVTPRRDPQNSQDWFGIEPPTGGPSPAAAAFTTAIHAARRPRPQHKLCTSR